MKLPISLAVRSDFSGKSCINLLACVIVVTLILMSDNLPIFGKNLKLLLELHRAAKELDPECTHFPEIFWPEDWGFKSQGGIPEHYFDAVRVAKQYCGRCPIREQCLEYALEAGENYGIWGGMTAQERKQIRRASRKSRGPSNQEEEN